MYLIQRLSSRSLNVIIRVKIRYKIKIILNKIFDNKFSIYDISNKNSNTNLPQILYRDCKSK